MSLLPSTLTRLCCKEESFAHIEDILDRYNSPTFRFIASSPIPAFQSVYRGSERTIYSRCNLHWLWKHITSAEPAWTELSTARLLELLNSKFRGRVSFSLEDSSLLYSSEMPSQGHSLPDITVLDWRRASIAGISRPELLHLDITRLVPNLTSLNISLFSSRGSGPTLLRIAGMTLPSQLTSLNISHEGRNYYVENLPPLPWTLTHLRWYLHQTDYLSTPRFTLPLEPQFMILDTPSFTYDYKALFMACCRSATLIRAHVSGVSPEFEPDCAEFEVAPQLSWD